MWVFIEKESNSLIGHCGFNILKGISETEIAKATLKYGFDKLNLKKVVALVYPENVASQNIIKKLGMKPEDDREFFGVNFLFFSIAT